ncbi:hypothetical protein [Xanthomonas fragariae]|nr:hypothetical protein [Xanthomonas fragariae]
MTTPRVPHPTRHGATHAGEDTPLFFKDGPYLRLIGAQTPQAQR